MYIAGGTCSQFCWMNSLCGGASQYWELLRKAEDIQWTLGAVNTVFEPAPCGRDPLRASVLHTHLFLVHHSRKGGMGKGSRPSLVRPYSYCTRLWLCACVLTCPLPCSVEAKCLGTAWLTSPKEVVACVDQETKILQSWILFAAASWVKSQNLFQLALVSSAVCFPAHETFLRGGWTAELTGLRNRKYFSSCDHDVYG